MNIWAKIKTLFIERLYDSYLYTFTIQIVICYMAMSSKLTSHYTELEFICKQKSVGFLPPVVDYSLCLESCSNINDCSLY